MKVKISAILMVQNEEEHLGRCLESVRGIADEIVIVDGFSTDKTEEVAKKFNARFIQHKFEGHIEQRNISIQEATYDHILVLDADEALSEELRKSILEVKENWQYDAYKFNRLSSYAGHWIRHGGWYPDRKLRLADRRKITWEGHNPHDEGFTIKGATLKHLKGDLMHYTYFSIRDHYERAYKYSEIMARAALDRGRKFSWFKLFFGPPFKFVKMYLLQKGFLDGFYGFLLAMVSSYSTFLKYTLMRVIVKERMEGPAKTHAKNRTEG
jgi:glycosyltransferase involved in cell wall biosynthesis